MCALGVMHFLETYLAGVFYVATPFGMLSPGSTVLFSGKLVMLLLLYIKEDAATVRQPIYGLLLGNALTVGLVPAAALSRYRAASGGLAPDIGFIDEMGWLMVWGTVLLYVDAILIILLYERLGRSFGKALFLRIVVSVACILTFDQIGFFIALHYVTGAPIEVLAGGWAGKMAATLLYSLMLVAYFRFVEAEQLPSPRGLSGIFGTLTYRERYEALVERAGRDGLTELLHRGKFDEVGEQAVAASLRTGKALTLLVIDADHFKSINDRFGHSEGDQVLKMIAACWYGRSDPKTRSSGSAARNSPSCAPFHMRWGNCSAKASANRWSRPSQTRATPCSVSIGVATVGSRIRCLADLYALADQRLYAAKTGGRDRVVGDGPQEPLDHAGNLAGVTLRRASVEDCAARPETPRCRSSPSP